MREGRRLLHSCCLQGAATDVFLDGLAQPGACYLSHLCMAAVTCWPANPLHSVARNNLISLEWLCDDATACWTLPASLLRTYRRDTQGCLQRVQRWQTYNTDYIFWWWMLYDPYGAAHKDPSLVERLTG
jgi:hypothetical protein